MFWDHFSVATFLQVSGTTVTSAASVRNFFSPFATVKLIHSLSPYKMSIWINIFHRAVQNRTRRHFQWNRTQVSTGTFVFGYKARSKSGPKKISASAFGVVRRRENLDLSNTFQMKNQSQKGDFILSIFDMTLRVFLYLSSWNCV